MEADIFNELNKKIIENTDDEDKLEAAVFYSADIATNNVVREDCTYFTHVRSELPSLMNCNRSSNSQGH